MTLTEIIAKIVDDELSDSVESFWASNTGRRGPICNGLFLSESKGRGTRVVMPDGLLLFDCGIKVVMEIENCGAPSPAYLIGKWAAVSIARYFIHKRKNGMQIPFCSEATMIQICNSATARGQSGYGTKPEVQWPNVEAAIRACTPISSSTITHYDLLSGEPAEFETGQKRAELLAALYRALDQGESCSGSLSLPTVQCPLRG